MAEQQAGRMSVDRSPPIGRRLLAQARPYRGRLGVIFAVSVLATPLALLVPLPLAIAIDSVIGTQSVPGFLDALLPESATRSDSAVLVVAVSLVVLIALLQQLQVLATVLLGAQTGERMVLGFRTQLFEHVQRLSLAYHDSKGAIDSTYRIEYDAPAVQHIAVDGIIPLVQASLTLLGMLVITALIEWRLALVASAVTPVLFVVSRRYGRSLRDQWRDAKRLESSAMAVIQETLSGLRVVKAFGQEEHERRRFVGRSSESVRARIRAAVLEGMLGLLVGLTTGLGTAIVLYVGIRSVQSGRITLGELFLIMSYLVQLYEPLKQMSKKIADLQGSFASAERAYAVLDEPHDVVDRPAARSLSRARGAVSFETVTFGYAREGRNVVDRVSFDVAQGTTLGIMGTTGAGKTTLVSLLTRFYDPTSGRITLDGSDLRDYRLADLRNQFAIVLQEPVLFSTTLAENIAYARPGASDAEIVDAATAAKAHDFIRALPQAYETEVGERGMKLSGGERQRISLARAFLKDAPILILDEPTSSVDVRTETAIMETMELLMKGRTAFVIAHRLSTLDHCDERIEVEHGRLVDIGTVDVAADRRPGPAARAGWDAS